MQRVRDIMTPLPLDQAGARPALPLSARSISPDTPISEVEPEERVWVADASGQPIGFVDAVSLARALRAEFRIGFWDFTSLDGLFTTSFEDALDAIVVVNADGIITFLNRAYEVILGITRAEVVGRHVTSVLPNSRMHVVARSGIPEVGRHFQVRGYDTIVERHPIFRGGELVGAIGRVMFRNINEVKLMVERLDLLQQQVEYYEQQISSTTRSRYGLKDLIGNGPAMGAVKQLASRAARTNSTVLILGESGTGKELMAHAIHSESPRANCPFVKVNCAAIPRDLLESELFGYESGAFSGALKGGKPGKFELAHRGTIFLDEVGDMPVEMQAKVLRAIQEREIQKVGGTKETRIDVRIICATNKNLPRAVQAGEFREDLYWRLSVIELTMPPLRERAEDIPLLVRSLMQRVCREAGIEVKALTPDAIAALQAYAWPGNVRELVHTLERLVNLTDGDLIDWPDLPPLVLAGRELPPLPPELAGQKPGPEPASPMRGRVQSVERDLILEAIEANGGNKLKAAEQLGIHRSVLYRKLKRWGIG